MKMWTLPAHIVHGGLTWDRISIFCPPEEWRSEQLKGNLDVMSQLLFSADFMSPVVKLEEEDLLAANSDVSVITAY